MIKVLGFCASPRLGNSKFLLERALDAAKAHGGALGVEVVTEYVSIRGKKLSGCVMCQSCMDDGVCAIKDDFEKMQEQWYDADAILYSVPVYHMGMPAQMKAFIDRLGNANFGRRHRIFGEKGNCTIKPLQVIGCIAQGIHTASGQEHTITQVMNHATISGAVLVTGDGWESYIGAGGWTRNEEDRNALEKQLAAGVWDAEIVTGSAETMARRAVELALILQRGILAAPEVASLPAYISLNKRVADHTM